MSIIRVENLSKKYIIGHDRIATGAYSYGSLRDSLAHTARGFYQRLRHPLLPNQENIELEEFWALKDINFEINKGDRVGIIGRNGAGKSTLLKILSRITEPTTGKVTLNGRVASLLEVGTGFHPELTGRENIYLNGAVLGMTRVEIKKKFDKIVDFSGVEKFLDTPVKRYSSGMYVRLAFSVAAHLEPEILLVDEVLAVGDIEFQKKCIGKMNSVAAEGRTILFVSHNMKAISKLCNRAVLIGNGEIVKEGDPSEIIRTHVNGNQSIQSCAEISWQEHPFPPGNSLVSLISLAVQNDKFKTQNLFKYEESINLVINFKVLSQKLKLFINLYLANEDGTVVFFACSWGSKSKFDNGVYKAIFPIPPHYLNEGQYFIKHFLFKEGAVTSPESIAQVDNPVSFVVSYADKSTGGQLNKIPGVVRADWNWNITPI